MQKNRHSWLEAETSFTPAALQIVVPVRDPELTQAALRHAGTLGHDLNVCLRLIDVHVVPYALPLNKPSVSCRMLEMKLRALAEEIEEPVCPELIYARDWEEGFRRVLKPRSIVIFGVRRTWWPTRDKRMSERLRRDGHQVIWVECH